jgi:hypothetical protein
MACVSRVGGNSRLRLCGRLRQHIHRHPSSRCRRCARCRRCSRASWPSRWLLALALAALRPSSGRRPPIHAAAALDAIARGRCPACSAHFKIPSSCPLALPSLPSGHVCPPPPLPSVPAKHSLLLLLLLLLLRPLLPAPTPLSPLPPLPPLSPDRHVSLQSRLLASLPRHFLVTAPSSIISRVVRSRAPQALGACSTPGLPPGDPSFKKRPMLAGLVHTPARRHPSPVCANVRPSALSCT